MVPDHKFANSDAARSKAALDDYLLRYKIIGALQISGLGDSIKQNGTKVMNHLEFCKNKMKQLLRSLNLLSSAIALKPPLLSMFQMCGKCTNSCKDKFCYDISVMGIYHGKVPCNQILINSNLSISNLDIHNNKL